VTHDLLQFVGHHVQNLDLLGLVVLPEEVVEELPVLEGFELLAHELDNEPSLL